MEKGQGGKNNTMRSLPVNHMKILYLSEVFYMTISVQQGESLAGEKGIINQKADTSRSYCIITLTGQIGRNRPHIKAERVDSYSDSPLQCIVEESDSLASANS